MYFLFNWLLKITAYLPRLFILRFKVYYEDKKLQGRRIRGKAVVVSNHRSIYDFALMIFLFWTRTLRCVIGEVIFSRNLILTWFLRALGGIKVERDSHDFAFLGRCTKVLKKGGVVEIYPEARLNVTDEDLLDFKPSAVYIALEGNAPIIPVYTDGGYFKKSPANVIIGTPIDLNALYDESRSEKENIHEITEFVKEKIRGLKYELEKQQQEKERK